MGQGQIKRQKKAVRKELQKYLEEFGEYLRTKPWWCPWFFWSWMQRRILKMEKIEKKW